MKALLSRLTGILTPLPVAGEALWVRVGGRARALSSWSYQANRRLSGSSLGCLIP